MIGPILELHEIFDFLLTYLLLYYMFNNYSPGLLRYFIIFRIAICPRLGTIDTMHKHGGISYNYFTYELTDNGYIVYKCVVICLLINAIFKLDDIEELANAIIFTYVIGWLEINLPYKGYWFAIMLCYLIVTICDKYYFKLGRDSIEFMLIFFFCCFSFILLSDYFFDKYQIPGFHVSMYEHSFPNLRRFLKNFGITKEQDFKNLFISFYELYIKDYFEPLNDYSLELWQESDFGGVIIEISKIFG